MTFNGLLENSEGAESSTLLGSWGFHNPLGTEAQNPYTTAKNWKRWHVIYVSLTIILFFSSLTYGVLAVVMTKEPSRLMYRESLMTILYGLCLATVLTFVVSIVHFFKNHSAYGTELENLADIFNVTIPELLSMDYETIALQTKNIRTDYKKFPASNELTEYTESCERTFKFFGI